MAATPPAGSYDLRFTVYDALTSGSAVSDMLTNAATPVTNGLFCVTLDFGAGVFTGPNRWLQLDVQTNGGGPFTSLTPRQPLTPAPYALYAPSAGMAATVTGSVSAGQLTGAISPGNIAAGTISSAMLAAGAVTSTSLASNLTVSGTLSAASFQGNGALPCQTVSGTAQQAAANTAYLLTNTALTTVTLPISANIGDLVRVSGVGAGGWQVAGLGGLWAWSGRRATATGTGNPSRPRRMAPGWWLWFIVGRFTPRPIRGQPGRRATATGTGGRSRPRRMAPSWWPWCYGGQIYTSTDSGATWTPRDSNRNW